VLCLGWANNANANTGMLLFLVIFNAERFGPCLASVSMLFTKTKMIKLVDQVIRSVVGVNQIFYQIIFCTTTGHLSHPRDKSATITIYIKLK